MSQLVSKQVAAMRAYEPGKPIEEVERELGITGPVKLASNENAWGPPPAAIAAIAAAAQGLHLYPDGGAFYLRQALSTFLGVAPEALLFGNGSNEVLNIIVRTFVQPGQNVVTSAGSFIAYKLLTLAIGREFREAPLTPDFGYDLEAMATLVDADTRVIFIANPNNPTGTYLTGAELQAFVAAVDAGRAGDLPIIVFDEAYFEFVDRDDQADTIAWISRRPRTIVTRTFSKAYGLAGARCGYAVADPELVDYMNRVREAFNLNTLAQAGALAALGAQEHIKTSVGAMRSERARVQSALGAMGYRVIPSETNFLLVDFETDGAALHMALMKQGVICRPMAGYGLPTCLRVTIGLPEENDRLLRALGVVGAG